MSKVSFSGRVKVKGVSANLIYKFDTEGPTFDQLVMTNFSHIPFNDDEKRILTADIRKDIFRFENLSDNEIHKYSKSLLSLVKKSKNERIQIESSGAGAFICLALIYSGKLPSDVSIHFKLKEVPLALFPESLVKVPTPQHNVSLSLCNSNTWVKDFHSLQDTPSYLELSHVGQSYDIDLVG